MLPSDLHHHARSRTCPHYLETVLRLVLALGGVPEDLHHVRQSGYAKAILARPERFEKARQKWGHYGRIRDPLFRRIQMGLLGSTYTERGIRAFYRS